MVCSATRKARCKRNQSGGGAGGGWGFPAGSSPAAFNTTVQNPIIADPIGNCRAAVRPGFIAGGYESLRHPGGLPGMNGGGRRRRGGRKGKKSRGGRRFVQSGGRYGFDVSAGSPAMGGTPWGTGYAPVSAIPCEASRSAIPPDGASGVLNRVGSSLWDGRAGLLQNMKGGGAGPASVAATASPVTSGSPFEIVPTARYTVNPPDVPPITTAAGTLVSINKPLMSAEMNPACLKTGGGRKRSRKASRKSRKAKKSRKVHKGRK
jgi:hypothetical protein